MSSNKEDKVKVGITIGDINGIGPEIILSAFNDPRVFNYCTPIVYGSSHVISYHKKLYNFDKVNHQHLKHKDFSKLNPKVLNVVNCWEDEVIINLGQPSTKAGECALLALDEALQDLQDKKIDVLVTAPVNKSQIKVDGKDFQGHTQYITQKCGLNESLMLLVSDTIKVGLVTDHIALKDVPEALSAKAIYNKLEMLNESLIKDFGYNKPRIAVFGLNPHNGEEGVMGKEEKEVIVPTIEKAKENGILAFGPYAADGFMGSGKYNKFDAVLAMYHDQGLIAFKSVSFGSGVNFTAGLPIVRTSPDHGTAYDLAGEGKANPDSLRQAIFVGVDIYRNRTSHEEYSANPLQKQQIPQD